MAKVGRKFVKTGTGSDDINLSVLPDAPDGSRIAVTNGTQTFAGTKTFAGLKSTATPSEATDVMTKGATETAINEALQGLSWRDPVDAIAIDADTLTPAANMRILVYGGAPEAGDAFEGHENDIAVRNGANDAWSFETASEGWALFDKDTSAQFAFNGLTWVSIGSTTSVPDATSVVKGKASFGGEFAVVAGHVTLQRRQVMESFTPASGVAYVDVSKEIVPALKEETLLMVAGAPVCVYGVDFEVTGTSRVSWSGLAMDDLIDETDDVAVIYWTNEA